MSGALKVYRWTNWRSDLPPAANGNRQSHEVMAAPSVAAVMRATGLSRHILAHSLGETGNDEDIATALSKPGTVFYRGINDRDGEWRQA